MKAHENWKPLLQQEIEKPYYLQLVEFLKIELNKHTIYPIQENWFNALNTSPEDIKVIILGQDPYFNPGQAHGYAFSVQDTTPVPPSLRNIYKEIESDLQITMSRKNGDLTPWVNQGIMLLNSILTVRQGEPSSHKDKGWEIFTDEIIKKLSDNYNDKVFILWGAFAQSKRKLIDESKHLVLTSSHPSPLAAHRFWGNKHFSKTNDYLISKKKSPIDWSIRD